VPEQAVEKYLGSQYIQHDPQAADGADASSASSPGSLSGSRAEHRDQARGRRGRRRRNHGLIKTSAEDAGTLAADFFRLEHGKIVEHWDILQPLPETSANDHPMF
jgi:predicted SnoaL-like aldol condensation-catalyzing enzyme